MLGVPKINENAVNDGKDFTSSGEKVIFFFT